MKKLLLSSFTIIFLIAGEFIFAQNSGISIKFCTVGQQYGVADLDKFSLAKGKDGTGLFYSREMENPNSSSVGMPVFRSNASNVRAWGQFGCYDGSYNPASGCVLYENIQGTYGKNYLQIRYSKWGYSSIPIKIYINDIYQTEFIPVDQGNWNIFTQTPWLEITLPCVLPVANAGSDKTYKKDATISLDGSGSSIGNGDRIIYHWQSLDGISLNNESSATPSFIASSKGNYKFVLWVENGCSNSVKDTVLINVVENMKPFANAGSDQYVYEGDIVRLSSSRSYDTNHDALTFLWSAPNTIILNDNHIADPFFTAPTLNVDTSYTLVLEANNGTLSSTARVNIHVLVKKPAPNEAYYHPFQNWDDDVDRIKTYSNALGGDNGVMNGDNLNPQIILSYDTLSTRSGFGRALKIQYKQLKGWSGYVESFNKKWYSDSSYTNLNNLFPDYIDPRFQNRKIDSIAFYYKLKSEKDLFLKAELHDSFGNISDFTFRLPPGGDNWQKKSIALKDFIDNKGKFIPEFAKYIMFVFADYPNNINKSGDLFLDDLYLVENNFQKPSFSNKDEQLSYLNEVNFRHMWEAVDPRSKFALDRHTWLDLISVDAIGFQLSSYAIAHKRGWINPDTIERRVENIITWLVDSCNHTSSLSEISANPLKYASYKGNWSHFLDNKTLARKNTSTEFSVFSDALLMAGVLAAKEYFSWNINIATKADKLYRMTDWKFFYKAPDTLRYSWSPELGYQGVADWFTEELDLAFLLGISTPVTDFRLPVNIFKSKIYNKPYCNCNGYIYSAPGANFTYYFLQMYARFNETSKRFINTKNAFLADIDFSKGFLKQMDYNALIYGHTACEGPDSAGVGTQGNISNYHAYGIENGCRYDKENKPNGTIAVYGSGAGMLFLPYETYQCIDYYYNDLDKEFLTKYNYNFWSPIFGFPDAFHLSPDKSSDTSINNLHFRGPWLSVPRFGIDVGPMLMNMDSYLAEKNGDQSLRDLFSSISYLKSNIDSFEFDSIPFIKPNPLKVGTITHPTCTLPTGSVVLNNLPSTGTYTITSTPGGIVITGTGTSKTISGLAPGTYTYKVTNATGCTSVASDIVVINSKPITPTAPGIDVVSQPTCTVSTGNVLLYGLPSTGIWTLTRTLGGTTSTGYGTSVNISGLAAGSYAYTVTNSVGCTSSASANVIINTQPETPTAPIVGTINHPTCTLSTGSVVLYGLPPTGTWKLTRSLDGTYITGTGTTTTISGLATSTYNYTVTNSVGCTSLQSDNVVINSQPKIPAVATTNAATNIVQTSFNANWNSATTATEYRLDVATNIGFASFVSGYNDKIISNITTFSVTGLSANTSYYYRVRAYNLCGPSSNSGVITTITLPNPPGAPTANQATNIVQTSLTANWNPSATATGYRLDVATNAGFTSFVTGYNDKDVGNVSTYSITGLSANTLYYYRVRAYNTGGASANSGGITTTTLPNPPAAPVAIAANNIIQTSFSANWNPSSTATGYRLDVATNIGFTSYVSGFYDKDVSNLTSFSVTGLSPRTQYYYRVRAYNTGGTDGTSNTIIVTTLTNPPIAPTGLVASSCNNLVTLKWRKNSDPYFLRYRIYGGLSNNPTIKIDSTATAISDTVKIISGLANGQTYYFRVTAVNYDGPESPFSLPTSTIVETGVVPVITAKFGNLLICSNLGDLIKGYQWFKGTYSLPNSNKQYYAATNQIGVFKVETVDLKGCRNSSNPISISGTKSLTLYPNPASVSFALKIIDAPEEKAVVSIINSAGVIVMEFQVENINDDLLKAIPVSNLVDGVYIVQVLLNQKDLYYTKIVVLK